MFTSAIRRSLSSSLAASTTRRFPTSTITPIASRVALPTRFYSAAAPPLTLPVVQERVLNLLKDFEKVDASKLTLDSHFINDLGLDSLDQVEITIAIEEEFNIELADRDADAILNARIAADKVFAHKHAMVMSLYSEY
ncbi:hypothetical protein HDV05_004002 [Chytridiales sp. JEL 0842]|nr:hypothetical protein HDV05_004002 [Chytridiales sp. JEL 0842]